MVTNTAAPPAIVMRILDRGGQDATLVSLGDPLVLKIELPPQPHSPFGIQARHLYAKSSEHERLHLLDGTGCPVDPLVFPQMQVDASDHRSLWAPFKAFRFPSTGVVNFEVQIRFCPNRCAPITCDSSTTTSTAASFPSQQQIAANRRRRHVSNVSKDDEEEDQRSDDVDAMDNEFVQSDRDMLNSDKDTNSEMNRQQEPRLELLPDAEKLISNQYAASAATTRFSPTMQNNAAYGLIYPLPNELPSLSSSSSSPSLSSSSSNVLPTNPTYFTNEHWPTQAAAATGQIMNPLLSANFTPPSNGAISFVSSWNPPPSESVKVIDHKKSKKFTAPRPLLRPDGSFGTPKYTEGRCIILNPVG